MRIGNNYLNQTNQLSTLSNLLLKKSQQLASGNRLINAGVDPAGMAIAQKMDNQIRSGYQAARNIYDGIGAMNVADQGIGSIQETVGRMRELAVRAGNGTLTAEEKDAIQQEFEQLKMQIRDTVRNTQFNNKQLLNGEFNVNITLDQNGSNNLNAQIADLRPEALNLNDLKLDTTDDINTTIKTLDQALEQLNGTRTQVGTYTRRLEAAANNVLRNVEDTTAANSRIADTEMARSMAEYMKTQNLQQMSTMLLGQTGQMNAASVLNILQSP
ncbi:hypothetical protein XO10_03740 [Marinitoga sp. 1135]|uniref:Flagellin n=1 Tax=Marinitoga piezophila (strain DSM 14283 / JCM 11233 / KA3) TaxID=443254 RepID=H2J6J1_MARPK|nr:MULTISPECIES: flagellin [Marinitoga]AEX85176.1 flagellin/flagellar hook associated protein [Marinitoga piezophila KA3]NUU95411.1 hypothetical protein [Marinitoga sp. 1135]NUU97338.1 hypothetical protein [Marinitoga sp. 1138]